MRYWFFFVMILCLFSCQGNLDEMDTYIYPPNIELKVIAKEPLLDAPVAIDFDEKGRIWVLEMRSYMTDLEGQNEQAPISRIKILEDENEDGIMDVSKIFLDSLVLPRSLLLAYDGLIYAEPPNLFFVEIENDKPRKKILIDSVYAVDGNVEHQPNSLTLHMDNWIYSSNSNMRYKRIGDEWKKEYTTPRGQWGMSSDNFGRLYYNTNALLLATDQIKPNALFSNPYIHFRENNLKIITEHQRVFPIQATAVNRGYQENVLTSDGKLIDATSACGPLYYRNQNFDEWTSSAFVALPEINAIKKLNLIHNGLNVKEEPFDTTKEYLISSDEGFRPVNLKTGPDGNIYIVDMHRGIIQHKAFMTSYLRDNILERRLDTVFGQGRILRMTPSGLPTSPLAFDVTSYPINNLHSDNAYLRDLAQQHIIQNNLVQYENRLREILIFEDNEVNRLHALWTLEGLGLLNEVDLIRVIKIDSLHLRFHAMDILTTQEIEDKEAVLSMVNVLMNKEDEETDYLLACHLGSLDILEDKDLFTFHKECLIRRDTSHLFIEAILADSPGKEEFFLEQLGIEKDSAFIVWEEELKKILLREKNNNPVHYYSERLKLEDRRTIGMSLYLQNCATCHGVDGEGKNHIAPSLVNSSLVSGRDEKLILISLHGLVGPFRMNNKIHDGYTAMPGIVHNTDLDDRDVKDILHYVRNAFASAEYSITDDKVCYLRDFPPIKGGIYTEESLYAMLKHIDSIGYLNVE